MKAPHTNVLVRMTPELKDRLQAESVVNQRSLTQEITTRLRVSLDAHGPTLQGILAREAFPSPVHKAEHERAPYGNGTISELDKAMLAVFRAMPVEKQLALLSLFK